MRCTARWRAAWLGGLVAGVLASSIGLASSSAFGQAGPPEESTPLVPSVVSEPVWIKASDDRIHIVYELELANHLSRSVRVDSISARNGPTLFTLRRAELRESMALRDDPGTPTLSVPKSAVAVVWMNVPVSGRSVSPSIVHTFDVSVLTAGREKQISYTGAFTHVEGRPPIDLTPPLVGRGWVTFGGCCGAPHEGSLEAVNPKLDFAHRFATEWSDTSGGRFVNGDPEHDADWVSYGKPVIAVAGGFVSTVVGDLPDQIPGQPHAVPSNGALGNRIVLRLDDGRFAVYGHLRAGSARVGRGEHVYPGEEIAEVGNSGDSSVPHLYFELHGASGGEIPFVLHKFSSIGEIPPLDSSLLAKITAGDAIAIDRAEASFNDLGALPLDRQVVDFPAG